jgi:membrane dipeptidase
VNFFYGFIDPAEPTVARLVDHIEHIASVAGIDHVGLGPDFVKEVYDQLTPPAAVADFEGLDAKRVIPGLEGPAGLPLVTAELVRRSWSRPDIDKVLGHNWLRVFRSDLGLPTS